jgi:hypothetical protein
VFDSKRLLNTILDHLLQLIPPEPAGEKRLDDIGEAEPSSAPEPQILESGYPESGVHATSAAGTSAAASTKMRAAS